MVGKNSILVSKYCNCTYCSEFKEVLEVLLFISLESVERYFRGELAAWKTKITFIYANIFRSYLYNIALADGTKL